MLSLGIKNTDAKQTPRNAKIMRLGNCTLRRTRFSGLSDELVALQPKILKSQWIVLRNTQGLPLQHTISGTSTKGMKAEKELPPCHCRSKRWIYISSKTRIRSPHLFWLLTLEFSTRCQKKSVSSTRGPGSDRTLQRAHDSSRISQASRGIEDAQKQS